MNFVAIIFVAFLAINSGPSSALTGNVDSLLRKNHTEEELGTCPMNSSISVKVFRNLKGEWLTTFVASNKLGDLTRSMDLNLKNNVLECADSRYITISGILKDTEFGNYSEATVGDYRNNTDGEAYDSCKRVNEPTIIAEDNANQTRKALQKMEQRMNSFEKTQNNIMETLINIEKTQNNINETLISFEKTQTSFQNTLTNIEQILNEMRVISNSTKKLDTEDKENAATQLSTPNPKSSSTQVNENVTTAPSPVPVPVKANITLFRTTYPVSSDISIPCHIEGYPVPRVVWYKDEQMLENSERVQLADPNQVIILRANTSDTGTYRCEASNPNGVSFSSISILVEGVYVHPNCTDNPFFGNCPLIVKANYCTHKYYARFCCKTCTIAGELPSHGPHLDGFGLSFGSGLTRHNKRK